MYRVSKRALDIILAIIVIFLLGWAILLSLIFYKIIFGKKSFFFIQKRLGRDKTIFELIKIRTMKINTEENPTHKTSVSDITKLGAFLRKLKIDEIPQVINVLRGDMSFVGPRPCLSIQKELIIKRDEKNIFSVKPGITGLAQINRIDMSNPDILVKYDSQYLEKASIKFDLLIILYTIIGRGSGDSVK